MPPLVTVLMSVYNGLPYLPQAVESVLGQTFADFEFLIVDDGSTDDSVACIRAYEDSRIRLVCNERNLGQAGALNEGLKLVRGKYIARMDQDDVCLPERLQRQVEYLERRPDVAVLGTRIYIIDPDGRKTGPWGGEIDDYGTFLSSVLVAEGCPLCHPSVMFRRAVVAEAGGYDAAYAPCEDFELWTRLAMKRHAACVISEPLLMFRLHKKQQSVAKAHTQRRRNQQAREKLIDLFCNGYESRPISLLLRTDDAFWNECSSKQQVRVVLKTLDAMLDNMRAALRLSPQEFANFVHRVYRWLGGGARVAICRRHRQSLPVYLFLLRRQPSMIRYPSVLFYPLFFIVSPLMIPKVSELVFGLERKLRSLLSSPTPHLSSGDQT